MQILIVEDQPQMANILKRSLTEAGYSADIADNTDDAEFKLEIQPYDLIVLDLLIPGSHGGGIAFCYKLREKGNTIPILMLTAKDSFQDKVKGLDVGADDYLTKPFNLSELLARIRALIRRHGKLDPVVLKVGTLQLDTNSHKACRKKRPITLTTKEYAVLEYLMRHPGKVINQTELLEHAWDYNYDGLSNVVETYIRYLRKKISHNNEPELIHTVRGSGYMIEDKK